MTKTRVAALQMQGRMADIRYNLDHVRELLDEAVHQQARVISVPEFFTTPIVENPRLWAASLPPENAALDLLREYATDHNLLIGGSYLEHRTHPAGSDVFNCYTLVQPDGTVTRHDKDLPTMIENAYYTGGSDDGIHQTSLGRVGTAVCWETIRTRTIHRLKGKTDFLMTGSHWWSPPDNWPLARRFMTTMAEMNDRYMEATPPAFARMLGMANIHSAHCGTLEGTIPLSPAGLPSPRYRGELMGEAQIIDNQGNRLARRHRHEGPGVISADLELTPGEPTLPTPDRFWIPDLAWRFRFFWWQQNVCGRQLYQKAKGNRWLIPHSTP
ncbi:MAG TPA: carbon-nitrogen hydrolase family protein [Marinobacter sp.]|nr:carbon-nitrogen hydrolase family protein [Marinobacter sp.]